MQDNYTNKQIMEISGAAASAVTRWKKQYLAEQRGEVIGGKIPLDADKRLIHELKKELAEAREDAQLAKRALINAIAKHQPDTTQLMFHSDQGAQYTANLFKDCLALHKIIQSMSRRGNCWDNAVIESFFKSFKTETVYQLKKLISQQEMRWLVSEYMGHYNHIRPHSTNGYIPPAKFEKLRLDRLKEIETNLGTKKC